MVSDCRRGKSYRKSNVEAEGLDLHSSISQMKNYGRKPLESNHDGKKIATGRNYLELQGRDGEKHSHEKIWDGGAILRGRPRYEGNMGLGSENVSIVRRNFCSVQDAM